MSSAASLSEAQLNANRQNAALSTGPRTESGKQRARLNGLRHGLTGQTVVMPHESREAYELFRAAAIAALEPDNDAELALAQAIADDSWRLHRARAIEENIFALDLATAPCSDEDPQVLEALTQARTFLDHAREIQLLTLYAGRIARAMAKNTAQLHDLQTERRQARAAALEEAILLAQLAQSQGRAYDPAQDFPPHGFAFSTAEIARVIGRRQRLLQARSLQAAATRSRNSGKAA